VWARSGKSKLQDGNTAGEVGGVDGCYSLGAQFTNPIVHSPKHEGASPNVGRLNLTCILNLALLSRFSRMGQLHPAEINFERQPGQIRAICDAEQDFRNARGCILQ
jgi:hypothetical protein